MTVKCAQAQLPKIGHSVIEKCVSYNYTMPVSCQYRGRLPCLHCAISLSPNFCAKNDPTKVYIIIITPYQEPFEANSAGITTTKLHHVDGGSEQSIVRIFTHGIR